MSKETKTNGLTYYYLYNPLTRRTHREDQLTDFNTACRLADSMPGIWEVHVVKQGRK